MKKFIIERDIPSIGTMDQNALQAAAGQSCSALKKNRSTGAVAGIICHRKQDILRVFG